MLHTQKQHVMPTLLQWSTHEATEAEKKTFGTVRMPLEETFFAFRFGMLVDRFGTPWMINCEKPM